MADEAKAKKNDQVKLFEKQDGERAWPQDLGVVSSDRKVHNTCQMVESD